MKKACLSLRGRNLKCLSRGEWAVVLGFLYPKNIMFRPVRHRFARELFFLHLLFRPHLPAHREMVLISCAIAYRCFQEYHAGNPFRPEPRCPAANCCYPSELLRIDRFTLKPAAHRGSSLWAVVDDDRVSAVVHKTKKSCVISLRSLLVVDGAEIDVQKTRPFYFELLFFYPIMHEGSVTSPDILHRMEREKIYLTTSPNNIHLNNRFCLPHRTSRVGVEISAANKGTVRFWVREGHRVEDAMPWWLRKKPDYEIQHCLVKNRARDGWSVLYDKVRFCVSSKCLGLRVRVRGPVNRDLKHPKVVHALVRSSGGSTLHSGPLPLGCRVSDLKKALKLAPTTVLCKDEDDRKVVQNDDRLIKRHTFCFRETVSLTVKVGACMRQMTGTQTEEIPIDVNLCHDTPFEMLQKVLDHMMQESWESIARVNWKGTTVVLNGQNLRDIRKEKNLSCYTDSLQSFQVTPKSTLSLDLNTTT